MLLPLKSCVFSAKTNQVQRPKILCWTFALRTSVAAVISAGQKQIISYFPQVKNAIIRHFSVLSISINCDNAVFYFQ